MQALMLGLPLAAPGCPAADPARPAVSVAPAASVPAPAPPPPAAPEPDLRLEWVANADAAPGSETPAPEDLSKPWKIPSHGLVRVHLRTVPRGPAGPDASVALLDARGRPVPHESRVYLVGSGPDGGGRIDVDLLDPSATSLTLSVKAGPLARNIPLRVE